LVPPEQGKPIIQQWARTQTEGWPRRTLSLQPL